MSQLSETVTNINSTLDGKIKRSKKRPTVAKGNHKDRSEWKDVLTFKPMEGTVDIPIQTTSLNRRHQYLIKGLNVRDYVRTDVIFAVQKGYVSHIISDLEWNNNNGRANFAKYLVLEAIVSMMSNIYMGLPDELVQSGRFAKGTQFSGVKVLRSFNANFAPLGTFTDGDKIVKPCNPLGLLDGLSRMFVQIYDMNVNNDNYMQALFADQLWIIPFMTFTRAERHDYVRAFPDIYQSIIDSSLDYQLNYDATYSHIVRDERVDHNLTLAADATSAASAVRSLTTIDQVRQLPVYEISEPQIAILNNTQRLANLLNAACNGNANYANAIGAYFDNTVGHQMFAARLTRFKVENDDFVRCVQKLLFVEQSALNDASDAVMLSATHTEAEAHDLLALTHIEVRSHKKDALSSYCYAALNGFTLPLTREQGYRTTIQIDETEFYSTLENRFNKLAVSNRD